MNTNIYLYDGTFYGLMTAVFDSWNDRHFEDIIHRTVFRENFTQNSIEVETDDAKAERVLSGAQKIYDNMNFRLYRIYLTSSSKKEKIIYNYLHILFKKGRMTDSARFMPEVDEFLTLEHHYARETDRMYGFVRFQKTEAGIYFSKIYTDHSQLEMLSPFFLNRMPGMKWVILDVNRKRAALCDGEKWIIQEGVSEDDITATYDNCDFEKWWRDYTKAITIKERKNPALQKKMVPLKYRKGMDEFFQAADQNSFGQTP